MGSQGGGVSSSEGGSGPWDGAELCAGAVVPEGSVERVPRLFALVEREGECGRRLFAWGVEIGAHASVFWPDGRVVAHCDSGVGAREMFALIRDVVLVWVAHPVDGHCGEC
ncbi:hypothetical protein CEP50_05120 [Actinopolyspora mortivallis]|uniref:Uncharacterized protein n=1 Tax=Actinopolyspora mortivallis TaxID=33906 RepID=A0A2T0GYX8_ACTMO|nr:hypothetical protein CEP50_05120 [Actinopolyspora mortivallis]